MELSSSLFHTYQVKIGEVTASSTHGLAGAAMGASVPTLTQIALVGEVSDRFKLVQPLPINFERDGDVIVASDETFYMFGHGVTRVEALKDYVSSLSEYYDLLASYSDKDSRALLRYLETYFHPIVSRKQAA